MVVYGLVNNGIRQFVVENHGEDAWREICADAGLSEDKFESMLSYEDAVTYDLVGAISRRLELSGSQVLEVFGKYWVDYAGSTSIGKVMEFQGESLIERLSGLDDLHERVRLAMPHLVPPSFEFEEGADGVHMLHYFSEREGLQDMVIGLLHGMSEQTGEKISVRMIESRGSGADHDVFEIRALAKSSAGEEAA